MIVVLASVEDSSAEALVQRWARAGARLMTCEDLSERGWSFFPSLPEQGSAVIGSERVATKYIKGVLVRLGFVTENELQHIHLEDRPYVAAEMMAFLVAWLNELHCPVLNRPTPFCLAGSSWRPEQWTRAAAKLGIPFEPARRSVNFTRRRQRDTTAHDETSSCRTTVTIIGDRCFGETQQRLKGWARALAKTAGVDLLSVEFTDVEDKPKFLQACVVPALTKDELCDAALAYLRRGGWDSKRRS